MIIYNFNKSMQKAKTTDDMEISIRSENKRKMSRQENKRNKLHKLRLKFKNAFRQIDQLKGESQEDHQQLNLLIANNQRITRLAIQSREKTRRIYTESIEHRRHEGSEEPSEACSVRPFTARQLNCNIEQVVQEVTNSQRKDEDRGEGIMPFDEIQQSPLFQKLKMNKFPSHSSNRGSRIKQNHPETNEPSLIKQSTNITSVIQKDDKKSHGSKQNVGAAYFNKRQKENSVHRSNRFQNDIKQLKSKQKVQNKTNISIQTDPSTLNRAKTKRKGKTQSIFPYTFGILFSIILLVTISS